MRHWANPAAVFALWLAAAVFTVSQLVTVGPSLKAIPAMDHAAPPSHETTRPSARRG
jgi:hypothetical protein